MTTPSAFFVSTYYSGTVAEKLTQARELYERQASRLTASSLVQSELGLLHHHARVLDSHMQSMDLGRLCSCCAARPDGGCCSAFMADNTDSLLILINLLLGVTVKQRPQVDENCCFLGAHGCFFLVKPIFCLNYNCKHILENSAADHINDLYRLAAAVLSQQTQVENLLLDVLRHHGRLPHTP
jgi:hypothetical protein